jgi:hypothetical protein
MKATDAASVFDGFAGCVVTAKTKFFAVGGFLPPSRVFSPHGRHNFAREERVIPAAAIPQDWAGVRRSSNRCVGATIRLEKKLENTG